MRDQVWEFLQGYYLTYSELQILGHVKLRDEVVNFSIKLSSFLYDVKVVVNLSWGGT